jgi:hypothetical protein
MPEAGSFRRSASQYTSELLGGEAWSGADRHNEESRRSALAGETKGLGRRLPGGSEAAGDLSRHFSPALEGRVR